MHRPIDTHSFVSGKALAPHTQKSRMPGIDEVDDTHVSFARIFPMQAARMLLKGAQTSHAGDATGEQDYRVVAVLAAPILLLKVRCSNSPVAHRQRQPDGKRRAIHSIGIDVDAPLVRRGDLASDIQSQPQT